MITLRTSRQFLESAVQAFFPYIDIWKRTKLNNVVSKSPQSDEYLSVLALNCVLDRVQDKMKKKLANTRSQEVKFEFTGDEGVVLYKTLLNLPLDREKPYYVGIVTNWIQQLDGQLITNNIYQQSKASIDAATSVADFEQ